MDLEDLVIEIIENKKPLPKVEELILMYTSNCPSSVRDAMLKKHKGFAGKILEEAALVLSSTMLTDIESWLSLPDNGKGYGRGSGNSYVYDDSDGGDGSGNGHGHGNGAGFVSGNGDGDGYGDSDGSGDGDGNG